VGFPLAFRLRFDFVIQNILGFMAFRHFDTDSKWVSDGLVSRFSEGIRLGREFSFSIRKETDPRLSYIAVYLARVRDEGPIYQSISFRLYLLVFLSFQAQPKLFRSAMAIISIVHKGHDYCMASTVTSRLPLLRRT